MGENDPAAFYYVLTESGRLWKFILYTKDDGKSYTLEREELGETGLDLSDVSSRSGGTYASMLYDGETGYLLLAAYTEGAQAQLYAIDPERSLATPPGWVWRRRLAGGESLPVYPGDGADGEAKAHPYVHIEKGHPADGSQGAAHHL